MFRRFLGVSLIGGLAALWLSFGHVAADPVFSLTTSPVTANLQITPGGSNSTVLQVMNNNPKPVKLTLELDQFSARGTTGEAQVTPISANDPLKSYVHFSQTSFLAQPGVWTQVTMKVNLPKSAALGYYYAVLFKPDIPTSVGSRTITVKGSNAALVLIDTNSANEHRQLQVTSFSATKKLYQYLPAGFNITVHNPGNIYLPPTGSIFISKHSDFKNIIATLKVNQGGGNVLPNSVRIFKTDWSDGFPVYQTEMLGGDTVTKNGQPVTHLHWDFTQANKFRFGKYYAHLALVYNDGKREIPVDSLVSFWIIPWKIMLLGLLVLIVILVGLFGLGRFTYRRYRKFNRSKPKDSM